MRGLSDARVFIGQSFLYSYGGSEVITLELAEFFSASGAEVLIAVHGMSPAMAAHLDGLPGVSAYLLSSPELDDALAARPVDIAWVHQQIIPERLLSSPQDTTFIFNHMSSFHPLEFAFSPLVESALASAVLFPSAEALVSQRASGLLEGIDGARLEVFGNPAPDAFAEPQERTGPTLRRLAVVSNHVPGELLQALENLDGSVSVTIIGMESDKGGVSARVDSRTLSGYDAVVTIGKTVQYAVRGALPVYCYDHFGGPGWLTEENFGAARWRNFSGRGFEKKSGPMIASEILEGFDKARRDAQHLAVRYGEQFSLERRMQEILERAADAPAPTPVLPPVAVTAHLKVQESLGIYMTMAFEVEEARRSLVEEVAALSLSMEQRVAALNARVAELEEDGRLLRRDATTREEALVEAHVALAEAHGWARKLEKDVEDLKAALG